MKCKYCDSEMRLDDVDYNYRGNKDNYFLCDKCGATAIEEIRAFKSLTISFTPPDNLRFKIETLL